MLVAATVCPHPPVLVPAVAAGAAPDLDALRTTCFDAVRRLTSQDADVVVVGAGRTPGAWDGAAGGSLRGFGVDVAFGGPDRVLPLALTIGAFLLDEIGWPQERRHYVATTDVATAEDCRQLGAELAIGDRRVA